ncbi:hypothetical protein [Streptomyces virginiae]|uniref:hypothetical protein n=1 Tax=Streptomyces virginiae TaxID=1961 RepID=UPI0034499775
MSQQPVTGTRYQARPIQIDAIHFDGSIVGVLAVMHFVDAGRGTTEIRVHVDETPGMSYIELPGPDGTVSVDADDWIIRSANGQLSRCNAKQFAATYEPAPNNGPA